MSSSKKRREAIGETGRARRRIEQEQAARRRQFIFLGVIALVIAAAG